MPSIAVAMQSLLLAPISLAIAQAVGQREPLAWNHSSQLAIAIEPASEGTVIHRVASTWENSFQQKGSIHWTARVVLGVSGGLGQFTSSIDNGGPFTLPRSSLLTKEEITDAVNASWAYPVAQSIVYSHFREDCPSPEIVRQFVSSVAGLEEGTFSPGGEGIAGELSAPLRTIDRVSLAVGAPTQGQTTLPYPITSNEFLRWLAQDSQNSRRMFGLLQATSPTLASPVIACLRPGQAYGNHMLEKIRFSIGPQQDSVTQKYRIMQEAGASASAIAFEVQTILNPYGKPKSLEIRFTEGGESDYAIHTHVWGKWSLSGEATMATCVQKHPGE